MTHDPRTAAKAWLWDATTLAEPSPEYDAWLRDGPQHVRVLLYELESQRTPWIRVVCPTCGHDPSGHTRSGMCDGNGTICHCSRMSPIDDVIRAPRRPATTFNVVNASLRMSDSAAEALRTSDPEAW